MRGNFERALKHLFEAEGYLSNNKDDRGGETIFGIASKWHPQAVQKMHNASKEEAMKIAADIYRTEYWNAVGCDSLVYPLDIYAFDAAVNQGVSAAKTMLRQCKNAGEFLALRAQRYRNLAATDPKQDKFLEGWMNRLAALREAYGSTKEEGYA